MVRKSTRRRTRRRRMRGGVVGKVVKGLVLIAGIVLGGQTQPTNALNIDIVRTGVNWLSRGISYKQRKEDIEGVIDEASEKASELYGYTFDNVQAIFTGYMQYPATLAEVPVDLPDTTAIKLKTEEKYKVIKYTFEDVTDVRQGEIVILKEIHPAIEDPDDPIPESYEVMKVSDQEGASKGRTFIIPKTEITLSCVGETCSLPRPGGRRRKTLRRRK